MIRKQLEKDNQNMHMNIDLSDDLRRILRGQIPDILQKELVNIVQHQVQKTGVLQKGSAEELNVNLVVHDGVQHPSSSKEDRFQWGVPEILPYHLERANRKLKNDTRADDLAKKSKKAVLFQEHEIPDPPHTFKNTTETQLDEQKNQTKHSENTVDTPLQEQEIPENSSNNTDWIKVTDQEIPQLSGSFEDIRLRTTEHSSNSKNADLVQSHEQEVPIAQSDNSENADETESDEQVDPKEPTGNCESTDWTEHEEHKEPREPSESYENTDCTQSEEHKELTIPNNSENADETESDEEVDPKEPTGNCESTDWTEHEEHKEPREPSES